MRRILENDPWRRTSTAEGTPLDTALHRLARATFECRQTTLRVRVRHYRYGPCKRTWRQDVTRAAAPQAKASRGGLELALHGTIHSPPHVNSRSRGPGMS